MTLFFDRNVGRRLPQALRMLRLDVIWHDERFGPRTRDEDWLTEAGRQGWLVITHDANIVVNESERRALIDAGVGCFVMAGGGDRVWDKARMFARAWPRMMAIADSASPPYLWKYQPNGRWVELYPG